MNDEKMTDSVADLIQLELTSEEVEAVSGAEPKFTTRPRCDLFWDQCTESTDMVY